MHFPLAAGLLVLVGCRQLVGLDDVEGEPNGPTVGFLTAASTLDELAGTIAIPVALAVPTDERVVVEYSFVDATAQLGTDFEADGGTLVFEPGDPQRAIEFTLVDDKLDETDETFAIRLASPAGATLGVDEHVVTISATPLPRVAVREVQASVEERDAVRVVIVLDRPAPETVIVTYALTGTATAGADYVDPDETTVELPPSSTTAELVFPILPDLLDEDDEQVIVTLVDATGALLGAQTVHTQTIVDDDPLPVVSFQDANKPATEGTTLVTTLRLSAPSGREVRVELVPSGNATFGVDFAYPMPPPVVIPPGQTQQPFPIDILVDGDNDEPDELAITTFGTITNGLKGAPSSFEIQIRR